MRKLGHKQEKDEKPSFWVLKEGQRRLRVFLSSWVMLGLIPRTLTLGHSLVLVLPSAALKTWAHPFSHSVFMLPLCTKGTALTFCNPQCPRSRREKWGVPWRAKKGHAPKRTHPFS